MQKESNDQCEPSNNNEHCQVQQGAELHSLLLYLFISAFSSLGPIIISLIFLSCW